MKTRKVLLWAVLLTFLSGLAGCSSDNYDDTQLWNKVNDLDRRVSTIESTLSRMNNDINAINVMVNAMQKNVYVTNVVETVTGYQIMFSDNRVININNGGSDGLTPTIGDNGNWWIGDKDTGVRAAGRDGKDGINGVTPHIGENGNWWMGDEDTGVSAKGIDGKDGETPRIGSNGNWWMGDTDTGISALGKNGLTPFIGVNGNWWIGDKDTGVPAQGKDGENGGNGQDGQDGIMGTSDTPYISIEIYEGDYYWVQIVNNVKTFILDPNGNKIRVTWVQPIIKVDVNNYWTISFDGGITFIYIVDKDGKPMSAGNCECKSFFKSVEMKNDYLIVVLMDGTVIRFYVGRGICEDYPNLGIPYEYHRNPYLHNENITIPSSVTIGFGKDATTGSIYGRLELPGIAVPYVDSQTGNTVYEYLELVGTDRTGHNVWVELDDEPRGNIVSEPTETNTMKIDIVFVVDNSGSMSEEADVVARDIIQWANSLVSAGIDARFGCVGYSVSGTINGAIDMTTSTALSSWLNQGTGTSRTVGFATSTLQNAANTSTYKLSDECGAMAILFADRNFNFRTGVNRVYVNFTDEPNQPNGNSTYSVEYFRNYWTSSKGTVYTVYSGSTSYSWETGNKEKPWLISEYTGGTTFYTNGNFTGVSLADLPVTGAMTHSNFIYFTDVNHIFDGKPHKIKLTIFQPDGSIQGERIFYGTVQ